MAIHVGHRLNGIWWSSRPGCAPTHGLPGSSGPLLPPPKAVRVARTAMESTIQYPGPSGHPREAGAGAASAWRRRRHHHATGGIVHTPWVRGRNAREDRVTWRPSKRIRKMPFNAWRSSRRARLVVFDGDTIFSIRARPWSDISWRPAIPHLCC